MRCAAVLLSVSSAVGLGPDDLVHRATAIMNATRGHPGLGVVNGRVTRPGEWEGTIMVTGSNGECTDSGLCTGMFIHPEIVMTAGHCCAAGARKAICGGKERPGSRLAVSREVVTAESGANDFCLLHLDQAVSDVPIYEVATSVSTGNAIIVGYGVGNNWIPQEGAGIQREGLVQITRVSGYDITITGRASGEYQNACNGDSGGPLFVPRPGHDGEVVVAGVTSRGSLYCPLNSNGIYTSAVEARNADLIRSTSARWLGQRRAVEPGSCPVAQCCYSMLCGAGSAPQPDAAALAHADGAGTAVPADGAAKGSRARAAPRNVTRRCANNLAPGSHEHRMTVAGEARTLRYFVPAGLSGSQEVPLIFFFHGYGGNGAGFERSTNANSFAEREKWMTIHPSGGQANGWNAGGCCPLSNSNDLEFTDAMLAWAEENMCVGKKFSSGFSNGGFFSNRLGCERGSVFTGIAPLAGPLAFSPSLSGPTAHPFSSPCAPGTGNHPTVLHLHGTSDGTVSYTGNALFGWPSAAASCQSWAEINRCTGDRTDGDTRHWTGCAGGSSVELVTYQGGGHSYFNDVTQRVFDKFLPLA